VSGLDATHDKGLKSWVVSANQAGTDFPIQNLPFGVFRTSGGEGRIGVAIGESILDLHASAGAGLVPDPDGAVRAPTLNRVMALSLAQRRTLRDAVSSLLREGAPQRAKAEKLLVPMRDAEMLLPAAIGDYTDFYASVFHATNVGKMFRPDNPLLPNYKYVPIGYHGRGSSIVPSGAKVRRPSGQTKPPTADKPFFGPSRQLDYEGELGIFVGKGNSLGEPVPIAKAHEHLFGMCLLNDWSARDIQAWEYQPLGPFLGKSFATTISPWIVTMEALAPFRAAAYARPAGDPEPLPYLSDPTDLAAGGIDIAMDVLIATAKMREGGHAPVRVSRANFRDAYWTAAQMLTHHASNGCNLAPGDLFGSGTISGPGEGSYGSLLEATWRGTKPIDMPSGEKRSFIEDGDEIIFRARCERDGYVSIGFGECRGIVTAAHG
jgi:fumarylacetoacetase